MNELLSDPIRGKSTAKEFAHALAQCTPADFDGHTEFHRLTAEQKLEWICQAATFIQEFKGKAHDSTEDRGQNSEAGKGKEEIGKLCSTRVSTKPERSSAGQDTRSCSAGGRGT